MAPEFIGKEDWESKVKGSDRPVLVEFVTDACPVCESMEPTVESLENKYEGRASFYRVDAMKEQRLAMAHGVQGVPTFKVFCKGEPVGELSGGVYPPVLDQLVEHALTGGNTCAEKRTKVHYEITGYI